MARSSMDIIALRRLARVYRRLLLLAVPAAIAGCQDGADPFAPEATNGAVEGALAPEALLAAASLDRIAFASENDIWGMSASGGGQSRLTSYSGEEIHPVWSPDHNRVAFVRTRNGHPDIYLMKADGTNGHWALPKDPGYAITRPSWAPDGKSFLAEIWLAGAYICKVDLATGQWSHMAPLGHYGLQGSSAVYGKDGSWIYYVVATGNEVRKFQPGGADVQSKVFTGTVRGLAVSPDGTRLAYSLSASGNRDIFTLNLNTGSTKRLTSNAHNDEDPAWSPGGGKIAFASDRSGKSQIYVADSDDGGNVVKLTSKTNGAYDPSWYR